MFSWRGNQTTGRKTQGLTKEATEKAKKGRMKRRKGGSRGLAANARDMGLRDKNPLDISWMGRSFPLQPLEKGDCFSAEGHVVPASYAD